MSACAATGVTMTKQADRLRNYQDPTPEIPRDNVDPTAPIPPLPIGSMVERFFVPGTTTHHWPLILMCGLFAAVVLYRRFP